MKKKVNSRGLRLSKQTISNLNEAELKVIYGGMPGETTKELTKIPTVTCCCWTASCYHY